MTGLTCLPYFSSKSFPITNLLYCVDVLFDNVFVHKLYLWYCTYFEFPPKPLKMATAKVDHFHVKASFNKIDTTLQCLFISVAEQPTTSTCPAS